MSEVTTEGVPSHETQWWRKAVAVSAAVVIVSTVLLPKIAVEGAAVDASYDDYDPLYEVSSLYQVAYAPWFLHNFREGSH